MKYLIQSSQQPHWETLEWADLSKPASAFWLCCLGKWYHHSTWELHYSSQMCSLKSKEIQRRPSWIMSLTCLSISLPLLTQFPPSPLTSSSLYQNASGLEKLSPKAPPVALYSIPAPSLHTPVFWLTLFWITFKAHYLPPSQQALTWLYSCSFDVRSLWAIYSLVFAKKSKIPWK